MRWYWIKIGLGALAVFVVGFGAVRAIRAGIDTGKMVFESSDPITIPMALVPFAVDGREVGTFQRVTILRDAPKSVSEVRIRVRLSDAAATEGLSACRLTLSGTGDLNLDEGFRCLGAEEDVTRMVAFGRVSIRGSEGMVIEVPLLLDSLTVAELRQSGSGVVSAQDQLHRAEAAAARAQAEKVATGAQRMADSIRASVSAKLEAAGVPPPVPEP